MTRPYPDGTAWDEALRQRARADVAKNQVKMMKQTFSPEVRRLKEELNFARDELRQLRRAYRDRLAWHITANRANRRGRQIAEAGNAKLRAAADARCRWNEQEAGWYATGCDNAFECMHDGVRENGFEHCPYCGGIIQVWRET